MAISSSTLERRPDTAAGGTLAGGTVVAPGRRAVTVPARRPLTSRLPDLHEFYSHRSHRVQFALTTMALCYGGGAAMFWLHAIYRGEQGPPIAAPYHWALDSTLGLVALSPVIFVLVPLTSRWLAAPRRGAAPVALGALFALVTTPGPVLHDRLVGHGTQLAQLATTVFGRDLGVAARNLHAVEHSALSECLLQLAVGLPVYAALAYGAFRLTKALTPRQPADAPAATIRRINPTPARDYAGALRQAA